MDSFYSCTTAPRAAESLPVVQRVSVLDVCVQEAQVRFPGRSHHVGTVTTAWESRVGILGKGCGQVLTNPPLPRRSSSG